MTEVTVETFKEAALQSQVQVGEISPDDRTQLREKIKGLLLADDVGGTAERVAKSIADMIWPERQLELKKKKAALNIERAAILEMVKDEMRLLMEARSG